MTEPIIDAWVQFPDEKFLHDPMFESLRRWPTNWRTLAERNSAITVDDTLDDLRREGASRVVASAWWGPRGPMITNDAVGADVRNHPDTVTGIASVDLLRPMDAVRELRRGVM